MAASTGTSSGGSNSSRSTEKRDIVIIGGGIIGSTSAYYLTRHRLYNPALHTVTLLEASEIAGGASGKAGGLLALWAYPSCLVPLSYRLHRELAEEHGGEKRWGYRGLGCGQVECVVEGQNIFPNGDRRGLGEGDDGQKKGASVSLQKRSKMALNKLYAAGVPEDLDWLDVDSLRSYEEMGDPGATAQVHPFQFTTAMAQMAAAKGAKIRTRARVTAINYNAAGDTVESVTCIDDSKAGDKAETLPATDVVIAAGPWTRSVLPRAPISALRAHSVTIRPSWPVSAYALFTQIQLPADFGQAGHASKHPSFPKRARGQRQQLVTPEIYTRPGNEVYACGDGDTLVPLPSSSEAVQVDAQRCQDVVDYVSAISPSLRDGEVTARQACYLPSVEAGLKTAGPLIGATGVKGEVLAAGHTCWGIQNGPATGLLVSELVWEGEARSASIGELDSGLVL